MCCVWSYDCLLIMNSKKNPPNKTPAEHWSQKTIIVKDSYGNEIPEGMSFHEYWERQHKLEEISLQESLRQKKERTKDND